MKKEEMTRGPEQKPIATVEKNIIGKLELRVAGVSLAREGAECIDDRTIGAFWTPNLLNQAAKIINSAAIRQAREETRKPGKCVSEIKESALHEMDDRSDGVDPNWRNR